MTSLFGGVADLVVFGALAARRRCGTIEQFGVKVGESVAFGADHVIETAMKLDGFGPGSFLG